MTRWLAAAAILWLLGSSGAQAQKSLGGVEPVKERRARIVDLRLTQPIPIDAPQRLGASMIVRQDVAPNAAIGFGLAKVYGKRRGPDLSGGERTVRTRKPAVTFMLKF
jgi:hypothetical protein